MFQQNEIIVYFIYYVVDYDIHFFVTHNCITIILNDTIMQISYNQMMYKQTFGSYVCIFNRYNSDLMTLRQIMFVIHGTVMFCSDGSVALMISNS